MNERELKVASAIAKLAARRKIANNFYGAGGYREHCDCTDCTAIKAELNVRQGRITTTATAAMTLTLNDDSGIIVPDKIADELCSWSKDGLLAIALADGRLTDQKLKKRRDDILKEIFG